MRAIVPSGGLDKKVGPAQFREEREIAVDRLWESFADFVEDKVRDRKLRWLVGAPTAAASLVVALGLYKQDGRMVNLTLASISIFLGLAVLGMALSRAYMRRQASKESKVVDRYANAIYLAQKDNPSYFTIDKWSENQAIGKKADTRIVRDIDIIAGDESVPAVWTLASCSTSGYFDNHHRDDVLVEARYLNDDGEEGTRLVTSSVLHSGRGIRITIFFDHDLVPHDVTRIRLTLEWPRYAGDLLDGGSTKEYWKFHRPTNEFVANIHYSKEFAPNGIRVTRLSDASSPQVQQKREADGTSSVSLPVSNVVQKTEYGYHIELK